MKRLLIGLTLAAALTVPAMTVPAMANSWRSSGATYGTTMGYAQGYDGYAYDSYAAVPAYGPPPVFNNGSYQGTDPDPFIRLQLRREWPHEFGAQ